MRRKNTGAYSEIFLETIGKRSTHYFSSVGDVMIDAVVEQKVIEGTVENRLIDVTKNK